MPCESPCGRTPADHLPLCLTSGSCRSTGPFQIFAFPTRTHNYFWTLCSPHIGQGSQETRRFGLDNFSPPSAVAGPLTPGLHSVSHRGSKAKALCFQGSPTFLRHRPFRRGSCLQSGGQEWVFPPVSVSLLLLQIFSRTKEIARLLLSLLCKLAKLQGLPSGLILKPIYPLHLIISVDKVNVGLKQFAELRSLLTKPGF